MKITFDLDGVIFPIIQYLCNVHGIDIEKITCHDIHKCDKLTEQEQSLIYGSFGKRELYENCGVFAGAEKLGQLADRADVYVNSWCMGEDAAIKREIIKKLAPNIPDENLAFSTPFTKKTYVKSDYIVEDNLDNVLSGLDSADHFFLINTPYNQGELPEKVTRVTDLNECMDVLLKIVSGNTMTELED